MNSIDLYRVANLLIQQRGAGAKAHAAQRVRDMRNTEDKDGERTWTGVLDAVLVLMLMLMLEAKQPAPGQPLQ